MKKNQTKVFVAVESGYEHTDILGVDLTLADAWKRHKPEPNGFDEWRSVFEIPIGSPFNFERYDPKHGHKIHENPFGDDHE